MLDRMNKGYRSDSIIAQCQKMDEGGMLFIGNFLGGLGGHGWGLGHAQETARVLNALHPTMVSASELTLFPDTPLSRDVERGVSKEANELERIQEMQEFIRCLKTPTVFKAEHVTIPVPVYGKVPEDKEKMIASLQNVIDVHGEESLKNYRAGVMSL